MLPSDPQVDGGISYEKEDGIHQPSDKAATPLQTTLTTERREELSRDSFKTGRTSARRASGAVEYN